MAFGINRSELKNWKSAVNRGEIAFLTHFWLDDRFPLARSVTKVGCNNMEALVNWGNQYGLKKEWIHNREEGYPHYDLIGDIQYKILLNEKLFSHIERFIENT